MIKPIELIIRLLFLFIAVAHYVAIGFVGPLASYTLASSVVYISAPLLIAILPNLNLYLLAARIVCGFYMLAFYGYFLFTDPPSTITVFYSLVATISLCMVLLSMKRIYVRSEYNKRRQAQWTLRDHYAAYAGGYDKIKGF